MDDKLKAIMSEVLEVPVDQIGENTTMDNTGTWDSLRHIELVVALEAGFHVSFPGNEPAEMTSFAAIRKLIGARAM